MFGRRRGRHAAHVVEDSAPLARLEVVADAAVALAEEIRNTVDQLRAADAEQERMSGANRREGDLS
jgi:Fe-S cluster assembly scaffold protein SufB